MNWKYTDSSQKVVFRELADGSMESQTVPSLPEGTEIDVYVLPTLPVPSIVTMRQARLALLQAGVLAAVTTAIDGLPSPQKETAQIEWEYSAEVHRDKALVQLLAPALGLNEAQLDALFTTASTI